MLKPTTLARDCATYFSSWLAKTLAKFICAEASLNTMCVLLAEVLKDHKSLDTCIVTLEAFEKVLVIYVMDDND